jgi:Competence protein CoiA-like family
MMSNHLSMGAIDIEHNIYVRPDNASKLCGYKCPDCNKSVIFKKGNINRPHFAHKKSNNPCLYYDKPNESQIHKEAKLLMQSLLKEQKKILFYHKCNNGNHKFEINRLDKYNNTESLLEHSFMFNEKRKQADIALIDKNTKDIIYIIEICYKHKTTEDTRPEPWFEINAENLIAYVNSNNFQNEYYELECIRDKYSCIECYNIKQKYELWLREQAQQIQFEQEQHKQLTKDQEQQRLLEKEEQDKIKLKQIGLSIINFKQNKLKEFENECIKNKLIEKMRLEKETKYKQSIEEDNKVLLYDTTTCRRCSQLLTEKASYKYENDITQRGTLYYCDTCNKMVRHWLKNGCKEKSFTY